MTMVDNRKNADGRVDLTRGYFERKAGAFDRLYRTSDQNWLMRRLNRRFRSDIMRRYMMTLEHAETIGAGRVLDVGCGSGRYLAGLAGAGAERLVGVDMSAPMLELARQQLTAVRDVDIDLICADFATWSCDERFDLVVAMGFFDYQSDAEAMLRKMRSLTDGSVIASFPSHHWFRTRLRRLRYRFKRCPVFFYHRHEIVALGRNSGFERIEIAAIPGGGMDHVVTFWT
ncbi:MAG: class I SAM-dependent methyltransferase [Candidatus Zixiibacteriota bacterium]